MTSVSPKLSVIWMTTLMYMVASVAGAGNIFLCLTEDGKVRLESIWNAGCTVEARAAVPGKYNIVPNRCGKCTDIQIGLTNTYRASSDKQEAGISISQMRPISICSELNKTTSALFSPLPHFVPDHTAILRSVVLVI